MKSASVTAQSSHTATIITPDLEVGYNRCHARFGTHSIKGQLGE